MRIEVLTGFKHEGLDYHAGDIQTVNDKNGEYFCRAGWAKDTDGVTATGNPSVHETVLMVDNSNRDKVAEEV